MVAIVAEIYGFFSFPGFFSNVFVVVVCEIYGFCSFSWFFLCFCFGSGLGLMVKG